jgi:Na+/proline symporter
MAFFSRTYSFWAGVAGGCFLTTATHGTDQLMVQRLLSARDERQSRAALMASWVVILAQFILFLLIGVLLYVYYGDLHLQPPAQMDRIYPEFIWHNLPPGVAGLLIAAILAAAMANMSAALNSLASTTVVDFLHSGDVGRARKITVLWSVALLVIAMGAMGSKSVLEAGLTIGSIPMGALLGTFLLGVLTRKPGETAAIVGVIAGLGSVLYVHFATPIAWTWYVAIGTIVTLAAGLAASLFEPNKRSGA